MPISTEIQNPLPTFDEAVKQAVEANGNKTDTSNSTLQSIDSKLQIANEQLDDIFQGQLADNHNVTVSNQIDQPLTDTQLRAQSVNVTVDNFSDNGITNEELRASPVDVFLVNQDELGLTNAELRASAVVVSVDNQVDQPLTDSQLRAADVGVSVNNQVQSTGYGVIDGSTGIQEVSVTPQGYQIVANGTRLSEVRGREHKEVYSIEPSDASTIYTVPTSKNLWVTSVEITGVNDGGSSLRVRLRDGGSTGTGKGSFGCDESTLGNTKAVSVFKSYSEPVLFGTDVFVEFLRSTFTGDIHLVGYLEDK